jgi:protein-S-isoprenylcysteine O-methyltransferase Ste14
MLEAMYVVGFNLAIGCAFARVAGIAVGAVRSALKRGRYERVRFGVVEAMTLLEPPVLALSAYLLLAGRESAASAGAGDATAALAGGALALGGLALCVWTLLSWRQLFVGHAVLAGQELVTGGAYAHVRHPVYLGGLVIWCALSLAFLSVAATAVTVLYVIPTYLLYVRSEEAMMLESFGDSYSRYKASVPMLLPWRRASVD